MCSAGRWLNNLVEQLRDVKFKCVHCEPLNTNQPKNVSTL